MIRAPEIILCPKAVKNCVGVTVVCVATVEERDLGEKDASMLMERRPLRWMAAHGQTETVHALVELDRWRGHGCC